MIEKGQKDAIIQKTAKLTGRRSVTFLTVSIENCNTMKTIFRHNVRMLEKTEGQTSIS